MVVKIDHLLRTRKLPLVNNSPISTGVTIDKEPFHKQLLHILYYLGLIEQVASIDATCFMLIPVLSNNIQ